MSKINEIRASVGQPTEPNKDDIIVQKLFDKIYANICKRCMRIKDTPGEFCGRCQGIEKDSIDFERAKKRNMLTTNIANLENENKFKQEQIDTDNLVETRIIKRSETGEPIIMDEFVGGLKPKYILENEIRQNKAQLDLYEKQLDLLKKAEENDKNDDTNTGGA